MRIDKGRAGMFVPQKIVGIPWFAPETYRACCAVMDDGDELPEDYSEWLAEAVELVAEIEEGGHRALKVVIDVKEFPVWCRAHNIAPDAKARVRLAKFVAFQEAGYAKDRLARRG
ncbi:MAG: hypothetical protein ABI963_06835 [Rhizomicrobium sp.]